MDPYRDLRRETKKRAVRKGMAFMSETEWNDLVQRANGRCELTGVPFDFTRHPTACRRPYAASVDRIDSTRGYTAANTRLVLCAVNLAMNQWGESVLQTIAEAYSSQLRIELHSAKIQTWQADQPKLL